MTLHVWLPAIRARSGVDTYTRRLAIALERAGARATITWLPGWREWLPPARLRPPPGASIVHSNAWSGHAFRNCGLPLVVTVHSSSVRDPEWSRDASLAQRAYYAACVRRWESASIAAASATIAVSHAVDRSLQAGYGVGATRVIHNWLDTELFRPPAAGLRASGPFRLLFVGNLTRRKGADLLPDIARRLGPGFELHIVGQRQPPPAGALPPNVIYNPPVDTDTGMVHLYQRSDAVLVPTRLEGFGYAALEAMACGRPVVATRTSAIPEVVGDGTTGILCPPGDVDAFVAGCRRLAEDSALRRTMGEAAREEVTKRFSEHRAALAYLETYRGVLDSRRDPP